MTEIVRTRRGWIRSGHRDACSAYLRETGLHDLAAVEEDLGASARHRDLGGGMTEVVTTSRRRSMETVRDIAGDEPSVAPSPLQDACCPTGREPFVTRSEVVG